LSSPPAVKMADGYFLSKLIFSDLDAENDTGFYVCLVLNNAGLVYREVYMDVSNSAPTKPPGNMDECKIKQQKYRTYCKYKPGTAPSQTFGNLVLGFWSCDANPI